MRLIVNWLLSALSLLIVAHVVPGFYVRGFWAALWAALAIGLINATLGLILKVITFPLTLLTLGIFWLVINALMIKLASALVSGFVVRSFWAAFLGGIVLTLVNMLLKWLVWPKPERA
jgi:putative membrane protein